jgi:hypothetical protein
LYEEWQGKLAWERQQKVAALAARAHAANS